ncbi:hypothetical protein ACFX2I_039800 [Malus domestica]
MPPLSFDNGKKITKTPLSPLPPLSRQDDSDIYTCKVFEVMPTDATVEVWSLLKYTNCEEKSDMATRLLGHYSQQ